MTKQNGVFYVSIPATTVKTVVLQDGREVFELAIVRSHLGFHFVRSNPMDSVSNNDAHVLMSPNTVDNKRDALVWLADQVECYREMIKATRAHRLAHKAENPDYTGPYDGYVF